MKSFSTFLMIVSILLTFYACDNAGSSSSDQTKTTDTATKTGEETPKMEKEPTTYYVMARSGLNLRGTENPKSEKLARVPYGAAVLADYQKKFGENNMMIEGLSGHMHPVSYGNHKGYIFDGFLSSIPLPKNTNEQQYVTSLKEQGFDASYEFQSIDDEESGYLTETSELIFPAENIQEAFMIAKRFGFFTYSDMFIFDAAFPDPSLKGVLMNTKDVEPESLPLKETKMDENGNEVESYEFNSLEDFWLEAYFDVTYDKNRQPIAFRHRHRAEGGGTSYTLSEKNGKYSLLIEAFAD